MVKHYFMAGKHLCAYEPLHVSSPLLCHRNTSCTHSTLMEILYFMRSRYLVLMIYFMVDPYFYVGELLHVPRVLLWVSNTSCLHNTLMRLIYFMLYTHFYANQLLHVG